MENVRIICGMAMLLICVVSDWKTKKIPTVIFMAGIVIAIVLGLLSGKAFELLTGLLPGILLVPVSLATGESIGRGDALTVMMLGGYLSFFVIIEAFFVALVLCGLAGIVSIRKGSWRGRRIIFTPFLLLGAIIVLGGAYAG